MLTTQDLQYCASILFPEAPFLGVFALNQLPVCADNQDALFIINTDTSNLPGTHWIAVMGRRDEGYCFDPLGYQPPVYVLNWMNSHYNHWTSNTRTIQQTFSLDCGPFCLHYLFFGYYLYNYLPLSEIVNYLYPISHTMQDYQFTVNNFISMI